MRQIIAANILIAGRKYQLGWDWTNLVRAGEWENSGDLLNGNGIEIRVRLFQGGFAPDAFVCTL
ncbi:MAG: hypothetical protein IPP17_23200 [Bacteroidetes bacterium]|nr:hypothetical protein [Bacteroidota bacterium]